MQREVGGERSAIPRRLLAHVGATAVLALLFYWPGGMIFNTVEPFVLGLPFYVFWEMLLLPVLATVNIAIYAASMRLRDGALMDRLAAGKSIFEAESTIEEHLPLGRGVPGSEPASR